MKKPRTAELGDAAPLGEEPLNNVGDVLTDAEEKKSARAEREAVLADSDKDAIDKIVLSNEFGKGGKIRIKRKGKLDQTYQYVATIKADDWDSEETVEWCKKMFGGGDYHCQTFRATGSMYKPFTFSIDYRYKGELDEDAIRKLGDNKGSEAEAVTKMLEVMGKKDDGMKMTDLVAMMKDSSNSQMQMMMMMMTMQQKSSDQQSQQTMTMMTAMMSAMATAMTGKQTSGTDALLLELIKQKQERSPMTETLEMMAQIKDLFDKPPKEEKEEDMLSKIMKVGAPLLSGMLGSGFQPGAPAPVAQAQVAAPPAGSPPAAAAPPANESAPRLGGLYATLPFQQRLAFDSILGAASRNADPSIYADLIIDQTPPDDLPALKETLTAPDWCAKLFGDENLVVSIRPWLDELRQMVLDYGTENPERDAPGNSPADTAGGRQA